MSDEQQPVAAELEIMAAVLRGYGAWTKHHTPEELAFVIRERLDRAGYAVMSTSGSLPTRRTDTA